MTLTISDIWRKIYCAPLLSCIEREARMYILCKYIEEAYSEGALSRVQIGNLLRRIRKDFEEGNKYWECISVCDSYDDFLNIYQEYTEIREDFPSRDQEPVDPACLPRSNEKLYGKGINSRVSEE